jgi:hypothetical protein
MKKGRWNMKLLNGYRMKLVLVGVVATIVLGGTAKADFTFGEPTNLPAYIANSSSSLYYGDDLCVSACGRFLFFGSTRPGGQGGCDIWSAARESISNEWSTPVNLGATVNSPTDDTDPSISVDLLSLFFRSERSGGFGGSDLYVTTRATIEDPWGEPINLGPTVNSTGNDSDPSISADGLSLYFSTWQGPRPGGMGGDDIWVTTRKTTDEAWSEAVNLGPPINTASNDHKPCISSDGLALFFNSSRPGGFTPFVFDNSDMYVSTRPSKDASWGEPVNLGPQINIASGGYGAYDPDVSSDGSTIYFGAPERRAGGKSYDFWQAPIITIVDFNGDGIVDSADMCVMVEHWGEDYSLCDIGPMPWGDGVVDVEDLKVLAEHLFEDYRLIAHWKLDETEGIFAADSVGKNDAVVIGGTEWLPTGGQVDGALKLDGVSGYATTPSVLSPAYGPFSIFAWINGGAPSQVIVSQQTAANWLAIDAEGNLMTELKRASRSTGPLFSEAVITDGQWHRIGFVWDGLNRTLYVDGAAVAEDTQSDLDGSTMGLNIGVDKNYTAGTFFSGLIDDIRIYNRAVHP